jgi:hypothetical protein
LGVNPSKRLAIFFAKCLSQFGVGGLLSYNVFAQNLVLQFVQT